MLRQKFDVAKLNTIIQSAAGAHAALLAVSDRLREVRQTISLLKASIASDEQRFSRSSSGNYTQLALHQEQLEQMQQQHERLAMRYQSRNATATTCREFAERNGWRDTDTMSGSYIEVRS